MDRQCHFPEAACPGARDPALFVVRCDDHAIPEEARRYFARSSQTFDSIRGTYVQSHRCEVSRTSATVHEGVRLLDACSGRDRAFLGFVPQFSSARDRARQALSHDLSRYN
jgi:hypothetical protein